MSMPNSSESDSTQAEADIKLKCQEEQAMLPGDGCTAHPTLGRGHTCSVRVHYSGAVCYLLPSIWQLVEKDIDAQRRARAENPAVFQRYAETLLRSPPCLRW
jgi:hypothetical protein